MTAAPTEQPLQFADFFAALLRHWKLVALITVLCTTAALAVALLMTPIFRAQVLLAPVAEEAGADQLSRLTGGLGGLVGLNLGSNNKKEISIATLSSRDFAASFIDQQKLIPVLFNKKWDADSGSWDVEKEEQIPTMADAVELFVGEVRRVERNSKTGLVTLAVHWKDRHEAARWANLLVEQANFRLRKDAIDQAQRRIEFLNQELEKTSVAAVKNAIYGLIENQINTIMLVNTNDEFAFEVIDPAMVPEPENKIRPRRTLIVLSGIVIGFLIGAFIALLRGPARP